MSGYYTRAPFRVLVVATNVQKIHRRSGCNPRKNIKVDPDWRPCSGTTPYLKQPPPGNTRTILLNQQYGLMMDASWTRTQYTFLVENESPFTDVLENRPFSRHWIKKNPFSLLVVIPNGSCSTLVTTGVILLATASSK